MKKKELDTQSVEESSVNTNLDQQVTEPEVSQITEDKVESEGAQPEVKVEPEIQAKPSQTRASEDINYKALREAKRKAEQERDELLAKIKEKEQVSDEEDDDTPITKGEFKRLQSVYKLNSKLQEVEKKLINSFDDFEKVVNLDNIEVLKARDPEFDNLSKTQVSSPEDYYNRAVSAYALIKKYNIYQDDSKYAPNKERIEKNLAKPRPLSSSSATSNDGLSEFAEIANLNPEERRRAIFKMAQERASKA